MELPKGTVYRHRGIRRVSVRRSKVIVRSATHGWVDTVNNYKQGSGFVCLPEISWAGAQGYWSDLKITPEMCERLGITPPSIPELSEQWYHLDVIPAYGAGYDNRLDLTCGLG